MNELKISLAAARVNAKMTQIEVAKALHVSKATIVNWENGKIIPNLASMEMLSRLYKVPIENIFLPFESTKR